MRNVEMKNNDQAIPLVSVLMTTYNRQQYLPMAIESILESTFTDFELIIVDDGSTDKTVDIAKSYAEKDGRIRFFQNEINLGDYPNRNKAASYAKGKYIKYVDADDYLYPHGLAHMIYYMEQPGLNDVAIGIFGIKQDDKQPFPLKLNSKDAIRRHYVEKIFTLGIAPLSTIIRRDIFERENGFQHERMVGDYECWSRLALSYPIALLPVAGCWYRKHDAQESNYVDKFLGDAHRITKKVLNSAFEKNYISSGELGKISKRYDRLFLKLLLLVFFKTKKISDIKYLLHKSGENLTALIKNSI